jgi:hypothetical protein
MSGRYGAALILLIVALVYTMAMPDGEWQRLVAMTLQGLALFVTLQASRADHRLVYVFTAIFVAALLGATGQALFAQSDGSAYVRASVFLVVLATLPIIAEGLIRQVKDEGRITVQTMMGVLCAYLLIMSLFAYSYAVIGEVGSGPFFNQGEQWNQIGDYIYYSLITITTVGMGDLTPATQLGRSLTAAEALIGQIYMVTVVAVIVTNLGRPRPPRKAEGGLKGDRETRDGPPDG